MSGALAKRLVTSVIPPLGSGGVDYAYEVILESVSDSLTAHAGGTQAAALALTSVMNILSTVATAGDSVKLPPTVIGLVVGILNNGANSAQVFGAGTDTVNGIATATGVAQAPGTLIFYTCNAAGKWVTGAAGTGRESLALLAGDGAINAHAPGNYVITKGSAAALTIAAPTATTDDGIIINVVSNTAFAHVLTFTGNTLQSGAAGHATLTAAAQLGCSFRLMAYQGKWNLMSSAGMTPA